MCLDLDMPLMKNVRTGLIDPDTPMSAKKIRSAGGKEWELVVCHLRCLFLVTSTST